MATTHDDGFFKRFRPLPPGARWVCWADHVFSDGGGGITIEHGPRACGTFGVWLQCRMMDNLGHARWLRFVLLAARAGFMPASLNGAPITWRWQFWRDSLAKRDLREIERKEFERRRRETIARWGEGAG